jgi:hypothetical protein
VKGDEPEEDPRSDLDRALEALLVDEVRVKIDPATGEIISPDGQESSLTDSPEPPTIP